MGPEIPKRTESRNTNILYPNAHSSIIYNNQEVEVT